MELGKILIYLPDGSYKEIKDHKGEFITHKEEFILLEANVLPRLGILVKEIINSYRHTPLTIDETVDIESLAYLDQTQITFKFNIRDEINPVNGHAMMYTGKVELYVNFSNELGLEEYILNVKTEGHVNKITIPTLFIDNDFVKSLSHFMSYLNSYKFEI